MAHPKERRHVALGLTIVKTLLPIFAIWLVVSFGGKTAAERTMIGMRRLGFRTLASSHLKYALREDFQRLVPLGVEEEFQSEHSDASAFEVLNATKIVEETKRAEARIHTQSTTFFIGLLSAVAIKLTSSIDDVVWLVPFLIIQDRQKVMVHIAIYLWVCLIQALLALAMAQGGVAALDAMNRSKHGWSSDKILSVGAGACLFCYGLWLAREWYAEVYLNDDEDDEDCENHADDMNGETDRLVAQTENNSTVESENDPADYGSKYGNPLRKDTDSKQDEQQWPFFSKCYHSFSKNIGTEKIQERSTNSLFIVAFLGSLDDLTLFVPMLVGQAMNWLELLIGATIAASIIVLVCIFLGLCKPVARILESIPLFSIVIVFGTILLVKGFFTMQ